MKKEIGGYIELDKYNMPMLHEGAVALNCGRNALAYLIRTKDIKRIYLPKFICNSIISVCKKEGILVSFYHIDIEFKPVIDFVLNDGEWLYLVNYYGQLSNKEINCYAAQYVNIIVDQAHSYFQMPVNGVDTIYTCRKYFGVADGAFLYTDRKIQDSLPIDESFERMRFLLGRYERTAQEFYSEYVINNHYFEHQPIKQMSKLTYNLLHAISYDIVRKKRENNFIYLHKHLERLNQLKIVNTGTYMYPLMINNGEDVRKILHLENVYIPTLWPTVLEICDRSDVEYKMTENILPLPIDQRYGAEEMAYLVSLVENAVNSCL